MKFHKKLHLNLFILMAVLILSFKPLTSYAFESPPENEALIQFGDPSQAQISSESIKILVWNVYKQKKEGFFKDYNSLPHPFDLILLQEAHMTDEFFQFLQSYKGFSYVHGVSFFFKDKTSTGTLTGSSTRSIKSIVQQTKTKEFIVRTPKTQILTFYPLTIPYKDLLVINIHAINFRSARKLRKQLLRTKEFIEAHEGPVIFAGDFNTWSSAKKQKVHDFFQSLGFQEVTFPEKNTFGFFKKLDRIYTRGLEVRSSQKIHLKGSDHPALMAEFFVK